MTRKPGWDVESVIKFLTSYRLHVTKDRAGSMETFLWLDRDYRIHASGSAYVTDGKWKYFIQVTATNSFGLTSFVESDAEQIYKHFRPTAEITYTKE